MFQRWLKRAVTLTAIAAITVGLVGAQPAPSFSASTDDASQGYVSVTDMVFGSAFTGVTYSDVYDNNRGMTALSIVGGRKGIRAAAYWTNFPRFGPTGAPSTGSIETTYSWWAKCAKPQSGALHRLSEDKTIVVPVSPSASVYRPTQDTLTTRDTLFTPDPALGCYQIFVRFFTTGPSDPERSTGSTGIRINYVPSGPIYTWDAKTTADGSYVLYTIASDGEISELQRSGRWTEAPGNAFRYYFTNCALAREFLAAVQPSVGAKAGLVQIPASLGNVSGKVAGSIAKKSGYGDRAVWAIETGTELGVDQAKVIVDGGNPVAGCA